MRKGIDCKGNIWEERNLGRMKDFTGCKFTKLTTLFPVIVSGRHNKHFYWLCRCECGNEITCRTDCLLNQYIQSCGCMTIEGVYRRSKEKIKETIGSKFGKLVVEEFAGYKKDSRGINKAMFKCSCECGNKNFVVSGNSLRGGLTKSCGCLTRSIGEENIKRILKENNIPFKAEYTFSDLYLNKNGLLRYDFALLNCNNQPIRLIEFDGDQHFKSVEYFGGKEGLSHLQYCDQTKNQYALSHNIPLVRIPYSKRDTIVLNDLIGNKYLVIEDKV